MKKTNFSLPAKSKAANFSQLNNAQIPNEKMKMLKGGGDRKDLIIDDLIDV